MKYAPANNIIFAFLGGFLAWAVEELFSKIGYTTPPEVSTALPGGVALALAHVWDVLTGDNKSVHEILCQLIKRGDVTPEVPNLGAVADEIKHESPIAK